MIVFCTTCKGRVEHIKLTLPENIRNNQRARFLLLDYNSQDGLVEWLQENMMTEIQSGKLTVYSHPAIGRFHVSHAKNMAARLACRNGADILVTLDADNYTGENFDVFIEDRFREGNLFLTPNYEHIRSLPHGPLRPNRGFAGRLAIRAQDFIKAGGYNEQYDTWRGEDIDLNARMGRLGYRNGYIDNSYLKTIPHGAEMRFREYPEAKQYDRDGAWKLKGHENTTVVNNGRFGCGTVYRNFGTMPVELEPIPTRIFGIGMHKTATNSLHRAFQLLGLDSFHWGVGEAPLMWQEMNKSQDEICTSKTLERWYALCDLPIPVLFKKLDAAYPGSKFILTVRDEVEWLRSVSRLWSYDYNPTRWMWEVYPFSNTIHQALYGTTEFDAMLFLQRYRQHNAEVREYFKHRPDDLLIMDMSNGAGWDELCTFLRMDVPNVPYPVAYVTRERNRNQALGSC